MIVAPPPLRPPVIHEAAFPFSCPRKPATTQAMEACALKRIVAADHRIDAQVAAAFELIADRRDRRAFVAGERAWIVYRHGSCEAEASRYHGGSAEGIAYLACVENRNRAHLADLAVLLRELRFH